MAKLNKGVKYRLNTYFQKRMGFVNYRRGWLKGDCPACNSEMKFGIHLSGNRTNCFKCGFRDSPIEVAMSNERIETLPEFFEFIKDVDELVYKEPEVIKWERKENVILPESFRLINLGSGRMAEAARTYLKGRGFDITKLALRGVGYCTSGEYKGYIILPFYDNNKLIYFNARSYMFGGTKFHNPKVEDFGIGKSILLFNADALNLYDTVYIVESVMNAYTWGDNAIATSGKAISQHQLSRIIRSQVKRVVFLLDPDAYKEAIEFALKLVQFKKVKVVLLPNDKDVNDLGKNKTMKYVFKTRYQSYNDLVKMKMNL